MHKHFNENNDICVEIYNIVRRWLSEEEFSIKRRRVENIDDLPFEYMDNDWLFEARLINYYKEMDVLYFEKMDEDILGDLAGHALAVGIDWRELNVHWLEEFMPRAYKWDKTVEMGLVYHTDVLTDVLGEEFEDEPLYIIIDAFLSHYYRKKEKAFIEEPTSPGPVEPIDDMPF